MSNLKQKYIQKFKKVYLEKEGINLSDSEALEKFSKLVILVKNVYQPVEKSQKIELTNYLKT
jgi:hypothetical protein